VSKTTRIDQRSVVMPTTRYRSVLGRGMRSVDGVSITSFELSADLHDTPRRAAMRSATCSARASVYAPMSKLHRGELGDSFGFSGPSNGRSNACRPITDPELRTAGGLGPGLSCTSAQTLVDYRRIYFGITFVAKKHQRPPGRPANGRDPVLPYKWAKHPGSD
jgi:hypothetical protein